MSPTETGITTDLRELAHAYGVQTAYYDIAHRRKLADPEVVLAVLKAMGAPVKAAEDASAAARECEQSRWHRALEPVIVAWDGQPVAVPFRLPASLAESPLVGRLDLENGEKKQFKIGNLKVVQSVDVNGTKFVLKELVLPPLPLGYHHLSVEIPGQPAESLVISSPTRAYSPDPAGWWGVFLPLYALHQQRSWGSGDFSDLAALVRWAGENGGKIVSTLPLLSTYLDEPYDPSPYRPVSRHMWSEFFLDVTRIPELAICPGAREIMVSTHFENEREAIRRLSEVDYRRQMALKRHVLEELCRCCFNTPERRENLESFAGKHPDIADYARFRGALAKKHTLWPSWPKALRQGNVKDSDCDEEARRYHLYVQWLAYQQMEDLNKHAGEQGVGLQLDLPLGVHPEGYDTWRHQDIFVPDIEIGAPPDTFFTRGQDWASPPLHPGKLRENGYSYYIDCLRHHLKYSSILRIDHVMGLHRLFWIPRGVEAGRGLYVRYPADEFYAVLTLESQRNKTIILGEDLGTVPPEVRPAMSLHNIQRSYVAQYELTTEAREALHPVPANAVAGLNTHDMLPFAAFWEGQDILQRQQMGLLDENGVREENARRRALKESLAAFLREKGGLTDSPDDVSAILRATLDFLGKSPARTVMVNLEDLWHEKVPQNVPGTPAEENWRHKAQFPLEVFARLPQVTDALYELNRSRKTGALNGREEAGLPTAEVLPVRYDISLLTNDDVYLFNEGNHFRLYEKLGAHLLRINDTEGTYFAVWAPNAQQVSVMGNFNRWNRNISQLRQRGQSGIWEGFIPGIGAGEIYKYHIISNFNNYHADKADPFGFFSEVSPRTASVVNSLDYDWGDGEWMKQRHQRQKLTAPMSIYEVHIGSWRRKVEEGRRMLTYRELAPLLADYVQRLGYTHVEFMPVMEHPFYASWGYQVTGYFAPTSRYGSPQDFMYLIDHLHQNGIGVILDWVPSHFPSDEHGLGYFDGTHLYEHADPRKGYHPDWNSYIFNYGRNEVRSFLLSGALFWLDKYHADGLRVDAVASMLYLDYSRKQGEWLPNKFGGKENLEAIDFLRQFNQEVYRNYPDVQTIAEESTAWPMVSRPTYVGGLGFGIKWDMGWMHDTLQYMSLDPIYRKFHQNDLTFRLIYAFYENFILPLSHDEVVHGKGSLLGRMPGDEWQKFANLRLLYGYMYGQPGKKLLFMGGEFGQKWEWYHEESLDWHLLQFPLHSSLLKWVSDLNQTYRDEPALHELDFAPGGFEWIDISDAEQSVFSFMRKGQSNNDIIIVAANFTPVPRFHYRIGAPRGGYWKEILNSDAKEYGGSGQGNMGGVNAVAGKQHNRPYYLDLTLPPLSTVFLKSKG